MQLPVPFGKEIVAAIIGVCLTATGLSLLLNFVREQQSTGSTRVCAQNFDWLNEDEDEQRRLEEDEEERRRQEQDEQLEEERLRQLEEREEEEELRRLEEERQLAEQESRDTR